MQVKRQQEELRVSSCNILAYQCRKAWDPRGLWQLLKTFEVMQSLLHLSHGCNVMQVTPAERKNKKEVEYLNEQWSALNNLEVHYTKQTFESVLLFTCSW